jgi:hypothetical protein
VTALKEYSIPGYIPDFFSFFQPLKELEKEDRHLSTADQNKVIKPKIIGTPRRLFDFDFHPHRLPRPSYLLTINWSLG